MTLRLQAGDPRKPFYDYSMAQAGGNGGAAIVFANWAFEFMFDAEPARSYQAYVAARTR